MEKEKKVKKAEGKTSYLFVLGVSLLLLSFLRWPALPYVFTLPNSRKANTIIYIVIYSIAEIMFWTGVFLVGEEAYKKYKQELSVLWKKLQKALLVKRSFLPGKRKNR